MIPIFILTIIIIIVSICLCYEYKKDKNITYEKFMKNNIVIFSFLFISILCLGYELDFFQTNFSFNNSKCLNNDISRSGSGSEPMNKIYRPYVDPRAMYMDVI
jgi:hypothetical protein